MSVPLVFFGAYTGLALQIVDSKVMSIRMCRVEMQLAGFKRERIELPVRTNQALLQYLDLYLLGELETKFSFGGCFLGRA